MKIGDKIILLEKHNLHQYDQYLYKCSIKFDEKEIFEVLNITKIYKYNREYIEYYTLSYKNEKFKYKILPEELISFGKYNKKIERKLKLEKLT